MAYGQSRLGIEDLAWGTHACRLYRSREELVEILVPYVAAGLRRNEACLWVTSGPLSADEAAQLMVEAVPEFDACLARRQIEIVEATDWYVPGARFDAGEVLEAWRERAQRALQGGYAGLRVTGDTSWLEPAAWDDFMEYERRVGEMLRQHRMIGLCTYCADGRSRKDIADVASRHDLVLTHSMPPATLGDVLYAAGPKPVEAESHWAALVRSVAAGDQAALHALYERARRPVYTLAARITGSRESAEEVTLDVFLDVWRRAGRYDPVNGTVLGWIMNQARSRAIDRLRFEQRRKRTDPAHVHDDAQPDLAQEMLELKQRAGAVREALGVLTAQERTVIEAAFFQELSHAEAAARLGQPLGTVKTRIRSALQKLRRALAAGEGR